jgi:hypothetical protein
MIGTLPERRQRHLREDRRAVEVPAERWLAAGVAAAAAVGGAIAGCHPTGNRASDVVLTAAFAGIVTLAGSISRPVTWIIAATAAVLVAPGHLLAVAVALAVLAVTAAVMDLPAKRVIGAVLVGGAVQVLLRLGDDPFVSASALAAAGATAPVLISAYRHSGRRTRKVVHRSVLGLVVLGVVFSIAGGVQLARARTAVERGTAEVRKGLDLAKAGKASEAGEQFAAAARELSSAHALTSSIWAKPSQLVPLVGQQVHVVDRLTGAGADASDVAARAAVQANVESLKLRKGAIDVDGMAAMEPALVEVVAQLDRTVEAISDSTTPWLVAPLASRMDRFTGYVDEATSDAHRALDAVRVVPGMLGRDGPRHYLIIFANPAESRDLGGFAGAWGEMVADRGMLTLPRNGKISALNLAGAPHQLTEPGLVPTRLQQSNPQQFWQNVTNTPDLPTAAEVARQLWPQSGGGQLDGVLYLDPEGIAALLKLTGPVTVPGLPNRLDATNVVPFLLKDQYQLLDVQAERKDLLAEVTRAVFDRLTSVDLPGPRKVADVLGPAGTSGRLLLHSYQRAEQSFIRSLDLDGAVPDAAGGDVLTFGMEDTLSNKIDPYVTRSVQDTVTFDPKTGHVDATVRITVRNDATATGLPKIVIGNQEGLDDGIAQPQLVVGSGLDLVSATVDGSPLSVGQNEEYGRTTYGFVLRLPPQTTQVVELRLTGSIEPADQYRLVVQAPGAATEQHFDLAVTGAGGWAPAASPGFTVRDGKAELSTLLSFETSIGLRFVRPGDG